MAVKSLPLRTQGGAIAAKYRNAGQTCVCANRIPQDGVYDAFIRRLAETAGAMKPADGFEPGAVIGPLIDMKAVEKVEAHIADALKKGAKVFTGGKRAAEGGTFVEPTVLTDVATQNFWLGQPCRVTNLDTTGCPIWILCGVERGSREPQES
jgi:acyl-CoA reductase-like NAD-dependent aldehyde dehydrogenase